MRLGFHHHSPEQAAVLLAFHQQATDELGADQLGRTRENGLREGWEGFYGFVSGLEDILRMASENDKKHEQPFQ